MMDGLAKLAIAGTSRLPNASVRADLPTDALIDRLPIDGVERRLLLAAGAAAIYRAAGRAPALAPQSSAAAADTRRPSSRKLGQLLVDIVGAKESDLLIEAAALLDRAGLRVPHDALPALLQASDDDVRRALRPILGERGRWLASCNPDWQWVVDKTTELPSSPSELETVWNEGTLAERVTALSRMHALQPALARDWLRAAWAKEKAEPRAQLLTAMEPSLTPDDEPFLEEALDDRSAAVRARLAQMLAGLPDSRLSQRMIERANAIVRYEPPMLSKLKSLVGSDTGRLIATPPEEIDSAWERDGIPAKAPQGTGKRAFWLAELLAAVPLRHWESRFACAPDVLIAAVRGSEWTESLLQGWTRSASNQPARNWLLPLWDRWIEFMEQLPVAERLGCLRWLEALLRQMPKQQAEDRVERMLKGALIGAFYPLMPQLARPWGRSLTEAALAHLRRAAREDQVRGTIATNLIPRIASAIPPELFDQALTLAAFVAQEAYGDENTVRGFADRSWKSAIIKFAEIVEKRKMLIQEIGS